MTANIDEAASGNGSSDIAVDTRVVVHPGTDHEMHGVVVEDFADLAGMAVDVAENRIVEAARRWAVSLDDGGLVFVDSDSLIAETAETEE
jgi:hypothetical protein